MPRKCVILLTITVMSFTLAGYAIADQSREEQRSPNPDSDWSVRIGAFGLYAPEYEGSDNYQVKGVPFLGITWRDTVFLNARNGLGAYVLNRHDVKLGLSVGYSFGRDEDDSDDLDGLGDVDGGATANALFKWKIDAISFNAHYEQQFTGEDTGFQVHLGLGYDLMPARKFMLKPSVRTSFASSDYMEAYFGVSSNQSDRSGLREYDTDAGFKSVGAQITAIYRLTHHWGIQASTGYDRLVDDAADSPVVKDENQFRIGMGLSYTF